MNRNSETWTRVYDFKHKVTLLTANTNYLFCIDIKIRWF